MKKLISILSSFALVFSILLFDSCAKNPVTGKRQLMLMSEQQEINMGKQSDPSIVAMYGLYQDDQLQAFINEKGKAMAAISHRPQLNYEFKILDSPVVNAFALPGGYVYFTRGIMAHFNNEAEFAGVLGHETGHVTARHSARQYSKQMVAQLGLIVGLAVSEDFRQFADVAGAGMQLLFLKFSRDNETEADRLGVEYSSKIEYDAHKMANFFKTLDRLSGGAENRLPVWSSTHPDPVDRFGKTDALADKWQTKLPPQNYNVNRNSYLRRIDGIVYGEDPRQGFVENNYFYHPELKFQFPVPQGWKTQNMPTQVQMAPENGEALMVFTIAQGNNLNTVVQTVLTDNGLTQVNQSSLSINGYPAIELIADKLPDTEQTTTTEQQKTVRTITYLINKNGTVYQFMGVSLLEHFDRYRGSFSGSAKNFRSLSDPDKINRQPERIRIKTVTSSGTLAQALKKYNTPTNRLEELAILNGMELQDPVTKGMLIKTLGK